MNQKTILLSSLVLCTISLLSCGKKSSSADADTGASTSGPTAGTAISFSSVTSSGMTATWGQATSSVTSPSNMQYKLVYSTSNNITTAATAQANGTLVMDWTANTLTSGVSGLSSSTTYSFAVLAKDSNGEMAIETASHATLCSGKVVFLASVSNGNMGGASGADTVCNSNKPAGFGGSTFKAMLTDSGSRAACTSGGAGDCSATGSTTGRMDWVFAPNDTLCTSDYLKRVGTTNANGYPQIPTANILASSNTVVFTGMDIYMGVAGSNNCSNWGATSGSATAGYANGVSGDHGFWANNGGIFPACSAAAKIYCVEQ